MRCGGPADDAVAEQVSLATLRALGGRLGGVAADEVAAQLPEPFAHALRTQPFEGAFSAVELYQRVPFSSLHVRAVCRALGGWLVGPARERLDLLPTDMARLFEPAPDQATAPGERNDERRAVRWRRTTERP